MKLLLVDDDRELVAALRRGLVADGFTVDMAHDGVDGVWMAREGSYDAIVPDLMLPGRNGFQVCHDLRAAGDWTPVLMLTAKSGDLDLAEALDTGRTTTSPFRRGGGRAGGAVHRSGGPRRHRLGRGGQLPG